MFDQLPPHDIAAEESVIASLMVADEAAALVAPIVTARDFYREANAWTFEACMALWERGEAVNQVTVAHELERRGRLYDAGGLSFLSDLIMNLPTPIGVEHYAALVRQDAMYRQLLGVAVNLAQLAYEAKPGFGDALAKAESMIYGLRGQQKSESGFDHLRDFLARYDHVTPAEEKTVTPRALYAIRTGLRDLDALLGGLKPGQLIVVGAHTGQGKSALACCIARNAAVTQNARVAIFTLEMPGEDLAMRMLASDARVGIRTLQREEFTDAEFDRIGNALIFLGEADVFIDSTGGIRPSEVRAKCLKLAKEHGLDLIIVDHLQIMRPDKPSGNLVAELTAITGELKAMALEFDLPIVLCAQLNRQNDGQAHLVPVLRDLRGSGSIEQDADVVIFIHRPEKFVRREAWEKLHGPDEPYPAGQATLIVAKQRNGAEGMVEVRYRGPYTRFEDYDLPAVAPAQGVMPDFMLQGAH